MRSLIMFSPGPNWISGQPATRQSRAVMMPHLLRMRRLYEDGTLLFGGPTAAGFAGMAIVETSTVSEASSLIRGDTAVMTGVMTFEVTGLDPYFDAFSGRIWSPA